MLLKTALKSKTKDSLNYFYIILSEADTSIFSGYLKFREISERQGKKNLDYVPFSFRMKLM